jgi:hypothetical protein
VPGKETLEYLPTQFVCEYLWTQAIPIFDGLIYGSSQLSNSANNIVLFPHAIYVEGYSEETAEEVTSLRSSDQDDLQDFLMIEEPDIRLGVGFVSEEEATLRLLVNETVTSHVQAISYEVLERPIVRVTMPREPTDF